MTSHSNWSEKRGRETEGQNDIRNNGSNCSKKKHLWFCHGSHVFGLWDISLKKSGYYKFFFGVLIWSDKCHLFVIFTAFSMKDFLLIFGQDKLDDICQLCYFYYQKRIYIWIRHMAIFSRDAVESKHPLFPFYELIWVTHFGG